MDILTDNIYTGGSAGDVFLHLLFERQALQTPDVIAVQFGGEQISYADLNKKADLLANAIISQAPNSLVIGVSTLRSIETVTSLIAVLKAGKAYLPIDPTYPTDRLEQIISDSGVNTVLAVGAQKALFKHLPVAVIKSDGEHTSSPSAKENIRTKVAYIIYTSGSTGKPKGVCVGHVGVVNLIYYHKRISPYLGVGAKTLQFAPLVFDASVVEVFCTLCIGGTLVLVADEVRIDPVKLIHYVDEMKVNRINVPFVALQYFTEIADAEQFYPKSLLEVITAGEQLKVTPQIIRFFQALPNCVFYNMYGPTETSVASTALKLEGAPETWPLLPTIGKAIDSTKNFVLDEQLNLLPDGEVGELCISGINVTYGYLNRPELTAEKFVDWQHNGETTRIYRSGDLCLFLPDGNIEYLGRKDTQVKIRGNRVEIGEIEVLLNQLDGVQQSVVIAREDNPGDKRLVAYLVASHGKVSTAQIRDSIEEKLPEFMMPSAFVWMTELPKTTSGKVDRNNLPKPDLKRPELATLYKPASTITQKHLTGIWMDLLQLEKIGIDDNFFELGGNSLLGLKTVAALKNQFNHSLPITKLYQFPTIAGVSACLDGSDSKAAETVLPKLRVKSGNGDVAVIGMAGRFPGANTIDELWQLLADGRESTRFFTDEELDRSIPEAVRYAPNYVKARGVVDGSDEFDPAFFGLSPRIAELMDPQQRIFLELTWEALESTGHLPSQYHGMVGVFAGCGNNTYYINNVIPNRHLIDKVGSFLVTTLNEKDYIATRIAYELDLKGPAVSVHSACSTSLLAIAQAVDSIRNGQCNVALAGGVSISSPINSGHLYQEGTMLSADGHCRSFDAEADGTVFSDGAGVVLLKSLEEAEADDDTIYGVIKGVGLNNDGAGKGSFTAPNATGQAGAIAMAIQNAGVSPADISYVEAHGTATVLGDPIEIEGLRMAFGPQDKNQYCAIGSLKSNMGHLVAAAGVAGFIKATLALYHKQIPASLYHTRPNPNIDFENSPFYVNTKLTDWDTDKKRIAGVSSFGVGGTNVHVIVEEYPQEVKTSDAGKELHLVQWSAKTEASADKYREKLSAWIKNNESASLADITYTLQTRRTDFANRYIAVAATREELLEKLATAISKADSKKISAKATEVAFMFPGQGAQFVNMGRNIYDQEPVFRAAVDECVTMLKGTAQEDILSVIFSDADDEAATETLKNTLYTQPALFIISYAMAKLWMSWGITPAVLTGHSIGEFVAAHLAGIFSLPDAVKLIATRAKMVSEAAGGDMLSVRMPEADVKAILPDTLSIAVINTKTATVVAGPADEIAKFAETLAVQNIATRVLQTSHAFHSAMMDSVVEPFKAVVKTVTLKVPTRPIISTITGKWLSEAEALDPAYWAMHVRRTVRFADVANLLAEDETRIMLEVGPGNVLSTLVRQQASPKQITAIAGIDSAEGNLPVRSALHALGQLWLNGIDPDWALFYKGQSRQPLNLPTYAFDRRRFWIEPVIPISHLTPPFEAPTELLTENSTEIPQDMPLRKDLLIDKLKKIFEDTSGIDVDSGDASFIEIGFDSLLLTQIATNLKKEFNVPITFRKLFEEYNSLDLLAAHLDSILPADKFQPTAAAPKSSAQPVYQQATYQQPVFQSTQPAEGSTHALNMIAQQLQLLANQVGIMQGGGIDYSQVRTTTVQLTPPPVRLSNGLSSAKPAISLAPASDISAEEMVELKKPFGATARIERQVQGISDKQQAFIDKLTKDYNTKTKKSKEQTQQHRPYMADPRVVSGFRPLTKEMVYPIIINHSKGSRLWDVDGNEYIDALNGFGSNMLGYQPEVLTKAIHEQVDKGYEIGPQHELAGDVCKLLCEFTQFDRAGLCNTGSEAVLGAMRIARTVTGRSLIVAFAGSYHGIMDEVIVRATKKHKTVPAASGILSENVQSMLILDYGTDETLAIIKERADEIAAVLVEPVQSRRPEFKPVEFLKKLRTITADAKIALVFDEVISGFRMHPGGAQAIFGVKADIGTYGKVIGGGMPVGAICGIKEYMDALDGGQWQFGDRSVPEVGVTYFAGTFVRHPLALAAAKASLEYMKERGPALQEKLTRLTTMFADGMEAKCKKEGVPITIVGFGSLWRMKFLEDIPYSELLFTLIRLKGIHILDGFPCFITDAHTEDDIKTMLAAFNESIDEMIEAGFFSPQQQQAEPVSAAVAPQAEPAPVNANTPPVPGAKLGRDKDGNIGWFISDDNNSGKYLQVK
ncbi:amino acid adenylation domain-containing protein [Mucilaginibacter sp. ZT4R22]|uniref:Amino acid adenylation domain-containing protein n=1 Tax=Mucilaginibacter pankratovii TaxID=2772110 RepID=A0ABR7WLS4_9SPHI|nr:polyketide synthase [Mucilaginibacter pankratovii]MBD1363281.1 amino acid adenylation domain-containing protein [Mucilaginibacter pankratovii]